VKSNYVSSFSRNFKRGHSQWSIRRSVICVQLVIKAFHMKFFIILNIWIIITSLKFHDRWRLSLNWLILRNDFLDGIKRRILDINRFVNYTLFPHQNIFITRVIFFTRVVCGCLTDTLNTRWSLYLRLNCHCTFRML